MALRFLIAVPLGLLACAPESAPRVCSEETDCHFDEVCATGACVTESCAAGCRAGKTCSASGACVAAGSCGADGDCSAGEFCSAAGHCLASGACALDGDCSASQRCSQSGVCMAVGSCLVSGDCAPGELCSVLATCIDAGTCRADGDCAPGFRCQTGGCLLNGTLCAGNDPPSCPEGQRCSSAGSCIDDGLCVDATDCPALHHCVNRLCNADFVCARDSDCPTEHWCSHNAACIPLGTCASDADCWALHGGEVCNAEFACVPGANCGGLTANAAGLPLSLMVVVDRSGSMATSLGNMTRLEGAVAAIEQVMQANDGVIRFGLASFPVDTDPSGNCTAGVDVPVADGASDAITTRLSQLFPYGSTPTNIALNLIAQDPAAAGLADPARVNAVLLVTDGACTCNTDTMNVNSVADALRALEPPITTYVLGVGIDDFPALNCNAMHGGTALGSACVDDASCATTTETCFYPANDLGGLQTSLEQAVTDAAVPCTLLLDPPPPDFGTLYVYLDLADTLTWVRRDSNHFDGFDVDPATYALSVYGPTCAAVRRGQAGVRVVYGCSKEG